MANPFNPRQEQSDKHGDEGEEKTEQDINPWPCHAICPRHGEETSMCRLCDVLHDKIDSFEALDRAWKAYAQWIGPFLLEKEKEKQKGKEKMSSFQNRREVDDINFDDDVLQLKRYYLEGLKLFEACTKYLNDQTPMQKARKPLEAMQLEIWRKELADHLAEWHMRALENMVSVLDVYQDRLADDFKKLSKKKKKKKSSTSSTSSDPFLGVEEGIVYAQEHAQMLKMLSEIAWNPLENIRDEHFAEISRNIRTIGTLYIRQLMHAVGQLVKDELSTQFIWIGRQYGFLKKLFKKYNADHERYEGMLNDLEVWHDALLGFEKMCVDLQSLVVGFSETYLVTFSHVPTESDLKKYFDPHEILASDKICDVKQLRAFQNVADAFFFSDTTPKPKV